MRNYWNIFVTFLVSGIWHGANWTFVVWGCMHGVFQIIEKAFGIQKMKGNRFVCLTRILVTFVLVTFAWIFFRMPTLADAWGVVCRIFDPSLPKSLYVHGFTVTAYIGIGLSILLFKDIRDEFFPKRLLVFENKNVVVRWAGYLLVMVVILMAGVFSADQFIYANF